jgi:hypothetical protein
VKEKRYERNLSVAGAVNLNGAENEEEPFAEQRIRKEKKRKTKNKYQCMKNRKGINKKKGR